MALGLAGNMPVVIIQLLAEKPELSLLTQDLDFHEILKLPSFAMISTIRFVLLA